MEARSEDGVLVYLNFDKAAESRPDLSGQEPFKSLKKYLTVYFTGQNPSIIPKFKLKGTPFQLKVWEELLQIPYGQVTTYGAISELVFKALGRETDSARAVGQAVGRNPISIIVPCHRVLAASNKLGGYASGLTNKKGLLNLEGLSGSYRE
jgi:methylated-DNA-[protein]-cysteine S-methyltransferase